MSGVDPSTLFGFNPISPYAKLFVDIFHLTTPKNGPGGEKDQPHVDENRNIVTVNEKISDNEKEEGEIDDNDNKNEDEILESLAPTPKIKSREKKRHKKKHLLNPSQQRSTPLHRLAGGSSGGPPLASSKTVQVGCSPFPAAKRVSNPNVLDLHAQIALDKNPVRLGWLNQLLNFMTVRGTPIINSPTVPVPADHNTDTPTIKQALDLFCLYQNTMDQAGGFDGCNDSKGWKSVAVRMAVPPVKAFVLRSIYFKYLLPFEKFQKTKERKSLLPTPVTITRQQQHGSSYQGLDEDMFDVQQKGRQEGQRRPGNILNRLGFKKKGNFKKFRDFQD